MAFRVNYNQQRGDRERAKEQKKRERLANREQESLKRKAERDGLIGGHGDNNLEASDAPAAPPAKETE